MEKIIKSKKKIATKCSETVANLKMEKTLFNDAYFQLKNEIVKRKEAENKLKVSKEFTENVLDSMPDGVEIVDQNAVIQFTNRTILLAFGDVIGKKCYEVYKINKKQCDECPLKGSIVAGETKTIEVRGIIGDKIFSIAHTGIRLLDGTLAVLESLRDITERKRAEEELKNKNGDISRMNKLMVGREVKMVELKAEIEKLNEQLNGKRFKNYDF